MYLRIFGSVVKVAAEAAAVKVKKNEDNHEMFVRHKLRNDRK